MAPRTPHEIGLTVNSNFKVPYDCTLAADVAKQPWASLTVKLYSPVVLEKVSDI